MIEDGDADRFLTHLAIGIDPAGSLTPCLDARIFFAIQEMTFCGDGRGTVSGSFFHLQLWIDANGHSGVLVVTEAHRAMGGVEGDRDVEDAGRIGIGGCEESHRASIAHDDLAVSGHVVIFGDEMSLVFPTDDFFKFAVNGLAGHLVFVCLHCPEIVAVDVAMSEPE